MEDKVKATSLLPKDAKGPRRPWLHFGLLPLSCIIGTPLLAAFFIFIIAPLYAYREIIELLSKIVKRSKFYGSVRGLDAIFAHDEIFSDRTLNGCYVLTLEDPHVSIERLRDLVQQRATTATKRQKLLYPKLTLGISDWMGYKFWAFVDDFDIKDHVNCIEDVGISPPDWNAKNGFEEFCKGVAKRQWKYGKPLWELLLIKDSKRSIYDEAKPCSILIWRQNHALSDGIAAQRLLATIGDSKEMLRAPAKLIRNTSIPIYKQITSTLMQLIKVPIEWTTMFVDTLVFPPDLPQAEVPFDPKEYKGVGTDWFFSTVKRIPIAKVKKIKQSLGADFSSVIFACLTSGIRKLYKKDQSIPSYTNCLFPIQMAGDFGLQNNIVPATVILPTGTTDPIKRVHEIAAQIGKISLLTSAILHFSGGLLSVLPSGLILYVRDKIGNWCCSGMPPFLVNNVMGPENTAYYDNTRILEFSFVTNLPRWGPHGCVLFTWSAEGFLHLRTLGANRFLTSYEMANKLADFVVEEFEQLYAIVQ